MRLLSLQCAALILIFLQSLSAAPLTPGNLLLAHLDYPPSGDFAFSEVVVLEEMTADGESVQTWPLGCTRTAMMSATMTWSDDRTMVSISCYDGVDGQAPTGYETNEVHTLHQDGTITVTSITNPFAKSFTKDATYPFVLADTTVVSGTDLWIVGEVYKSSTFGDTSLFFGYTTIGSTGSATYSSANGPALTLLGVQYLEANYHLLYREQTKIMAIDSMPKSTTFPTLTTVVSATTYPSSIWADSLTNVYSIDPLTRLYKDTSGTFQTYQAQSNFMDRDDAVTGLDIFGVKTLFTRMGNSIYTRNDTGTGFTAKTLMHTFGELSRVIDMKAIPAPDSCTDLKMNQNETDVDCGGICGASCADTQLCSSDDDCLNNYCTSDGECATPTCLDSVQNQNETDTDCGGVCDGCLEGKNCLLDSDCETNACENGICISTCFDGLLNQNETDVDCGAVCGATCFVGKNCFENSDCETDACVEGICIPKCLDGLLNQNETDVDCGGVCGNTCSEGENCLEHSDCTSNYCSNSVCSVEPVPQVVPLASTGAPDSSPEANEWAPQETNPPQSTQVPQGPRTPRSRISVNSATHLAGNVLLMTIVCFFV